MDMLNLGGKVMIKEIVIKTKDEITVLYSKDIKVIKFYKDLNLYVITIDLTTKYLKERTPYTEENVTYSLGLAPSWTPMHYEDFKSPTRKWFITHSEMEKFLNWDKERIVLKAYDLYEVPRRYIISCKNEKCGYKRICRNPEEIHTFPRFEKEYLSVKRCPYCHLESIAFKSIYEIPTETEVVEVKQ